MVAALAMFSAAPAAHAASPNAGKSRAGSGAGAPAGPGAALARDAARRRAPRRCRARRLRGGRFRLTGNCRVHRRRARPIRRVRPIQSTGPVPPPRFEPDEGENQPLPRGPFRAPTGIGRPAGMRLGEPTERGLQARGAGVDPTTTPLEFGMNLDLTKQGLGVGTPSEPSIAAHGDVIFYTQNWTTGYSADGGLTWKTLNPYSDVPGIFGGFCCDQVVIYVPQVDRFVWLLQYSGNAAGSAAIRMVVASPAQVAAGNPGSWTRYDFDSAVLLQPNLGLDQPDLAVGANSLYMTVDKMTAAGKVNASHIVRIGVRELGKGTMNFSWYTTDSAYVHPVQHVGQRGYFVQHRSTSKLRVYFWDEGSNQIAWKDVDHPTIPDKNWSSLTPGGKDWLDRAVNSGGQRIRGATLAGNRIWLAWTAARDTVVDGKTKQLFKQPHIEIAKLDPGTLDLKDQDYVFNDNHAFARPMLDTNARGEVGLGFAWGGGGNWYASQGVGLLTGKREFWESLSNDADDGDGKNPHGDYSAIRAGWPHSQCFLTPAIGFRAGAGVARVVTFDRRGDNQLCTPRPRFREVSTLGLVCPGGIRTPGDPTGVQGTIQPARPGVPVMLVYAAPDGSVTTHNLTTDAGSRFNDTGPPGQAGTWRVAASWPGDTGYLGDTATCSFFVSPQPPAGKSASAVTINCPPESLPPYATITVSGRIEPTRPNTPVTVTYGTNGGPPSHSIATDANGNFSDSYQAGNGGTFEVQASWAGDSAYAGASSGACPVSVASNPK
jgi:hypothetical protein